MRGTQLKQPLSMAQPSQRTQAKRYFWDITTPFNDNQNNWRKKERSEIPKMRDSAIAATAAMHEVRINTSHTNRRRHNMHGSIVKKIDHSDRWNLSRNLDSSFLSVDEQGNII
jgi:hypothetical protein